MTHSRLSEYLAFRQTTKRLLLIVGLWPSAQLTPLSRLLPYTQIFLSCGTVFAIIRYVQENFTNVARVTKGMSIMTSFLSVILKVSCMIINRKDLIELHEMLDGDFMELIKLPELTDVVAKGITTFRWLSRILSFVITVACFIYVLTPLLFIFQQQRHGVQPVKYILIFPGKYPWKILPNGLLYKLHYTYETAANMALICITAGVDSLFTLYTFQMMGQLRAMSYRIKNIDGKNDYRNTIRHCALQHITLMKSCDILEKIYGPIIMWISITNAIVLCSLIFQVSQMESISLFKATLLGTYIVLKLIQTFMYAWAGTCLTEESEKYREAVYSSDWYSNKYFMISVIIMLTQRPLILTACKFSVVSLDIFGMVLNTTASYFFLLRTIHDDQ